MKNKKEIAFDWLKRYTGTDPDRYGDWILLTNFQNYVDKFATRFNVEINGLGGPMTSAINSEGLSIINFGIGSANAATIMDLLSCINPKGVLFLGKCGGLKKPMELELFFFQIAPIRGKEKIIIIFPKKFLPWLQLNLINNFPNIFVKKRFNIKKE